MSSLETRNQEQEQNNSWIVVISKETKESQEWQENQRNTQIKLEELRKEIKENWMSINLVKRILENINEIPNENKPFILWGIFSWLNQKWISILWVDWNGKIILKEWKEGIKKDPNIASREDVLRYSNLLNSANISASDINKALLYRTNSVDEYIDEKLDWKLSTSEYVQRLMEKYKFSFDWILVKDMTIWSENDLKSLKQKISEKVTDNQADKEFLLTYFDDKFYRKWKSNSENDINDYKNISDKNQKKLLDELSNLTPEQKFAVWIKDSNNASQIAKEWTKDPIWTLQKNINADNFLLAIIFWAIWAIFWWKKWFWIWALLWFWIWAWGLAFAGEAFNKSKKDKSTWEQSNESSETKTEIYGKINFNNISDDTKKLELQRIWWDLSKNDNFLKAPTTVLSIFESNPAKTFDEIKTTLEGYWIKLTSENKDYYETIFAEILKQRKAAWIWAPVWNETIEKYLTRSSGTTEAAVTVWVASENIWERFQVSGYSENGRNYIIGQDGNPKLIEYSQLSPEFQKQIERLNTSGKVVNNFLMILTTLSKKEPKFNSYIAQLQEKIEKIDISKKDDIENLLKWIYESKDNINTSLNNGSDAQTHPWTLNIDLSKDEEVLQLIRKIDSESAKQHLIEKLFSLTSVSDDELNNFITNPSWDHTKIQSLLWNDAYIRFSIEISEKKSQAEIYFIENRENFKKQIKEKNKNISDTEVDKILDEQYKPMITGSFIHSFAKDTLLETFLAKNTEKNWLWEYNGDNELLKLYWDIVWVGWGNISDKSLDWWKEALLLIGTEIIAIWAWAVTLWVWFYAVNAAVWWARWYRWIKALQLWAEAGKLARLWRWWTMSVIEWSSFYLWYGWAQSMIEWENMYSKEWLMHSIAFAWAFRALRAIPWLQFKPDVALSEQKLKITSVLAADTAALWAIWLGFDGVLFEPGEWTAEHFIQAFAMAVMFRWMTHAGEKINLKFRRNGERVEMSWNPKEYFSKSAEESAQIFENSLLSTRNPLLKSLLPKKAWEEVKIWDKTIKKTTEWKYEFNWTKYDKIDDILPVLSKELTDAQIIAKISEWWTKNLNKLFNWVVWKEIQIWDDIFRFRVEWWNKILEIKNWNWWATKSIDDLSDWQAQLLLDRILWSGIKEKIIWIAREKIENIKINNIISTTERDTLIKRFWKWAWEKISKEFDDFMTKIPSKSDGKSHIYWAERFKEKWFWNAIAWLLIWFKEWTWKTMLWWVVTNEIWETYQAWWISERYEKYDIYNDWIDTILNWILFKKVSLWRAIITQTIFENTLWNN